MLRFREIQVEVMASYYYNAKLCDTQFLNEIPFLHKSTHHKLIAEWSETVHSQYE